VLLKWMGGVDRPIVVETVEKCSCDGGGWIVTLDRGYYKAPATAEMVRLTRCVCLDRASGRARSGGAGAG
jgi:hypothetical protein